MFADFHCQEVMKFRVLSLHECFLPLEAADLITISLSHASLNKSTEQTTCRKFASHSLKGTKQFIMHLRIVRLIIINFVVLYSKISKTTIFTWIIISLVAIKWVFPHICTRHLRIVQYYFTYSLY